MESQVNENTQVVKFDSGIFNTGNIETVVFGRSFLQPDTREFLVNHYKSVRYRDAIHLLLDKGEIWVFEYGVVIFWGVREDDVKMLRTRLTPFIQEPMQQEDYERYQFAIDTTQALRIHNDSVTLPSAEPLVRLAVSHALAQSAKLGFFEDRAGRVISENAFLAKTLANTGSIPLSRKQLAKLRGSLFETTSDISLNFNLLDTPEFFWNYPELEHYYLAVAKYLDLTSRIELLNHKLSVIHELLDMLASEQNHKHSAFLEWVIIVLIAMEIVLYLF